MRHSKPEPPRVLPVGGTVVVEAPTAQMALADIQTRLGDAAEIVAAGKVRRGGVAGFFAREMIQLTVRVPGDVAGRGVDAHPGEEPDSPAAPAQESHARAEQAATAARRGLGGLADMLSRMTAATDRQESTFQDTLRRELGVSDQPSVSHGLAANDAPSAATTHPTNGANALSPAPDPKPRAVGVAPQPDLHVASEPEPRQGPQPEPRLRPVPRMGWTRDPSAPAGTGPARWSGGVLHRLGVPAAVVDAVLAQDPVDDAGWTQAVAAAVAGYCRPLPSGASLYVGPRAGKVGDALGLPVVARPEEPPAQGSAAIRLRDSVASRNWLADVAHGRWLHLVVGGTGWHGLLFDEPLAVSWTTPGELPAALQLCSTFGLVLGFGLGGPEGLIRANPVDVAVSLRAMVERV